MCLRVFSIPTFICLFAAISFAQNLKADYQFQGNLNSSVAGAPAMTNLTGSGGPNSFQNDVIDGYTRQTLRFPFNSGLSLNIAGLIPNNTYTFVGLFRLDATSGFRCIAGCDPLNESGAYIQDGRLVFENVANAPFQPNHYIQVAVVREANGTVRAYRDGGFRVNQADPDGDFIFDTNILALFQDPLELASAGNIARLRVYDGPLTTSQIRALDRLPNSTGGGDQSILFWSQRDGFAEIYTMNPDGSNQLRLTHNELHDYDAKFSPDRAKLVYAKQETGLPYQIWIMNADGSGQTRLTNSATTDLNPSWRPDGQKIIFSRCDANIVCDIYTMDPNGSNVAPLSAANTANDESLPRYSPNGQRILFGCSTGGSAYMNANICGANADGTNRTLITNTTSPVVNYVAEFSPDGTKIAFTRRTGTDATTREIYVINSNGTGENRLTNNAFGDYNSFWSPDGQRIAFNSIRDTSNVPDIYSINSTDGGSIQRLTVNSASDVVCDWYRPQVATARTQFDYDGDGRSDLSVRRPLDDRWYLLRGTAGYTAMEFGVAGDRMVPADYDGDGKTDVAVFRPSNGTWYVYMSQSQTFQTFGWGQDGDQPVPTDRDADGKTDLVLYRPSNNTWYTRFSNGTFNNVVFGVAGDKPVVGDFDADGKGDIALFRPSNNNWYILKSSLGFFIQTWGEAGDLPLTADFDGDGATDQAVFRPSTGQWFLSRTTAGFSSQNWGQAGDIPVAADYDGDGKADVAVFRPSTGTWYIVNSTTGILYLPFGQNGDVPTQSSFNY